LPPSPLFSKIFPLFKDASMIHYNKKLKNLARQLRKNMTEAEKLLWSRVRRKQLGCRFYRQKILGDYIVDFYCPRARLIVEIDGGQHNENKNDRSRDEWFSNQGLRVIRFWNNDVLRNIEGVIERLMEEIEKRIG